MGFGVRGRSLGLGLGVAVVVVGALAQLLTNYVSEVYRGFGESTHRDRRERHRSSTHEPASVRESG